MVEMPKDFLQDDAVPATDVHTFTGNRGLAIEEPLIFEIGSTETSGVDFEEPQESEPPRRLGAQRANRSAGPFGAAGHPPLCAPVAEELLHRHRHLSARLVHHEAQSAPRTRKWRGFQASRTSIRLQPEKTVQGALALMNELSRWLIELTGMQAVALSPKAGAHGEMCGMMAIRAAIEARGEAATRRKVLVPESAHGTNPATAALLGFTVRAVEAREDGTVSAEAVRARLGAGCRRYDADESEYLRAVRARNR